MKFGVLLLILCMVAAGCTEAPAKKQSGSATPSDTRKQVVPSVSVDPDRPKGTLDGTVIADDELPVPFAKVFSVELNATAIADGVGYFTFGLVNAGAYYLLVSAPGHESKQVGVEVKEGEPSKVSVMLIAKPVAVPHTAVHIRRGYVNCRILIYSPVGTSNGNSKGTCSGDVTGADNGTRYGTVPTTLGVVAVLGEAKWQSSLYTNRHLEFGLSGSSGVDGKAVSYAGTWETRGESPLVVEVNNQTLNEWAAGPNGRTNYTTGSGQILWILEIGPGLTGQAVDVGIGMAQSVEVAVSVFYVLAPTDLKSARVF